MKSCVQDSRLKAFVDNELPELELRAVRSHTVSCDFCRVRVERIAAMSAEVKTLMGGLVPANVELISVPEIVREAGRDGWPRVSWVSAVAAVLMAGVGLLAFIHEQHRVPATAEVPGKSAANLPIRIPLGGAPATLTVEVSARRDANAKHASAKRLMIFVRVDGGEPIEAGTIERVKLPAAMFSNVNPAKTPEVSADAVVDESGRVRAIRVLGSDGSDKE